MKIDRCSTKLSVHLAYAFALFTLLFPPHVLAELPGASNPQEASNATENLPDYFTADLPDDGLSYELTKQANGDYLMESTDGSQSQTVDAATISQTSVELIFGDDLGGPFSATLTLPDNLGGLATYGYYGDWNPDTEFADGTLILPDGSEKELDVWVPNANGLSLKAVVITIVVSAAAISAIGCTILGWITNCIDDCADACEHGVKKATEGACGTCTCECYPPPPPPPPPCDNDNDRDNFTSGNKDITIFCPVPDPQEPQQL